MANVIAILDDEPDRVTAMSRLLARRYPRSAVIYYDNAPDMILWLREHLHECALLCLDHDLGPNRDRDGKRFDPGTGREVADYLASCEPACPVIIHSTNTLAVPGMQEALEGAHWQHHKVVPYEDLLWIREVWIEQVAMCLRPAR